MLFKKHILTTLLLAFFSLISSAQKEKALVLNEIKVIGNKTTKQSIIEREYLFELGNSYSQRELDSLIKETKNNLYNTFLFNFVTIDQVELTNNYVSLLITLEERWYLWVFPIFEVQETNLSTWLKNKDLEYVNYGLVSYKQNFRGRKEQLGIKLQSGYTEEIKLLYHAPFINRNKTQGVGFTSSFNRNHEVTHSILNNKVDRINNPNKYLKEEIESDIFFDFRPRFYNTHTLRLKYTYIKVDDTIVNANKHFLTTNQNKLEQLSISYRVKRDLRNNKNYPLTGFYFDFEIGKDGLGFFKKRANNLYTTIWIKKFWQISDRWFLSGSIKNKSYYLNNIDFYKKALGYGNDLVRGYEYYVINGDQYSLIKSQLRFNWLKEKVFKVKIIPFNKFNKIPFSSFLGTYFDIGYVSSNINNLNNPLNNEIMYGGGISIDFVTYYDMVLRTEFSINRMKEPGVYIHLVAPI